jgi:XTP/dITP diphosphohydrolase
MTKLLIATKNPAKFEEYKGLLQDYALELVSLKDLSKTNDVAETGATIDENATLKAMAYGPQTQLPTIADDTAFLIDELNWPGVHARRVWGPKERAATDEEALAEVLKRAADLPNGKRSCRYVSTAALWLPASGTLHLGHGAVVGELAREPRGTHVPGFPYDLLFYLPEKGCTVAEYTGPSYLKHRKQAILQLDPYLRELEQA